MLVDNHGRSISYARLAVTDRCNLRCFYCMPEHGLEWLASKDLMTAAEMLRLCSLLTGMGIQKIRITGGEPFVRKDMMEVLTAIGKLPGLGELTITTNGVLTAPFVPKLKKIGVRSVNISLDTLDRQRFLDITHRDELPRVLETLDALDRHGIEIKINAVVMEGKNTQDILELVELTSNHPYHVRFIEEMPFNGQGSHYQTLGWNYVRILESIRQAHPDIRKMEDPPHSTAYNYQIPGHRGKVGIIAAYSRTFCGTCNRIRITPQGTLKTCLYDEGVLNLKVLMRKGLNDADLQAALIRAFHARPKDGLEAEQKRKGHSELHESMATIGG